MLGNRKKGLFLIEDTVNNCFYARETQSGRESDFNARFFQSLIQSSNSQLIEPIRTIELLDNVKINTDEIKMKTDFNNPRKNRYYYVSFNYEDFLTAPFYELVPTFENNIIADFKIEQRDITLPHFIERYHAKKRQEEFFQSIPALNYQDSPWIGSNQPEDDYLKFKQNLPRVIADEIFSLKSSVRTLKSSLEKNCNFLDRELKKYETGELFVKEVSTEIDFYFLADVNLTNAEKVERLKDLTSKLEKGLGSKNFRIGVPSYADEDDASQIEVSETVELTQLDKNKAVENFFVNIDEHKKNLASNLKYVEKYFDIAEKIDHPQNETFESHIKEISSLLVRESAVFENIQQYINKDVEASEIEPSSKSEIKLSLELAFEISSLCSYELAKLLPEQPELKHVKFWQDGLDSNEPKKQKTPRCLG